MANNFILAKFARLLGIDSTGTPILKRDMQAISATVASNALTITLQPTVLEFRSNTLTNGIPVSRTVPSAISVVVPSGATLGTTNNIAARLLVLAVDNAGTVELAVANVLNFPFEETSLLTTVALDTTSDSAGTAYSVAARTNVAYRLVGFVDITQAIAGTWAVSPTLVHGVGASAASYLMSSGWGQTWQNVLGSRAIGTTYTNTTGRPIQAVVSVTSNFNGTAGVDFRVNGVAIAQVVTNESNGTSYGGNTKAITATVPPGATYGVFNNTNTSVLSQWYELR
jgi:hypothetical protein